MYNVYTVICKNWIKRGNLPAHTLLSHHGAGQDPGQDIGDDCAEIISSIGEPFISNLNFMATHKNPFRLLQKWIADVQ